jgi:peptidoglycan/xylan/chitin deacetylase (PgdA/CDA1 family)
MTGVKAGSIILMHDIHATTVDAVPGLIAKLKAAGFTLVTVPQLLGSPTPGTVYYSQSRTG